MLKQAVSGDDKALKIKTDQFYKNYKGYKEKITSNQNRFQNAEALYRWCLPDKEFINIIKTYFHYTMKEDSAIKFFKLLNCYK